MLTSEWLMHRHAIHTMAAGGVSAQLLSSCRLPCPLPCLDGCSTHVLPQTCTAANCTAAGSASTLPAAAACWLSRRRRPAAGSWSAAWSDTT